MKSNSKSFKIVSKFYVIYGDGVPIYVGYTNRTVKQRFSEHKHDKDFSDYNSVESIELKDQRMSFDFTWDYNKTCENADEVSKREEYLVNKCCTQTTCYQKAIGGGQTWAFEKGFVKNNRDNPKFKGMSSYKIKAMIEEERAISADIGNFVNHIEFQYRADIGHFISDINSTYRVDIGNFVNHMEPKYRADIGSFVNCMRFHYRVDVGSFVNHMESQYRADISHLISNMNLPYQIDIRDFVKNMNPLYQTDIGNFVRHMERQYQVDIHNFINNMKRRKK